MFPLKQKRLHEVTDLLLLKELLGIILQDESDLGTTVKGLAPRVGVNVKFLSVRGAVEDVLDRVGVFLRWGSKRGDIDFIRDEEA